jgi:RHS repeat-associated protein
MGYTNRIRYAGGEYDRRTGYTHFGERFYDPTTTKFTQQDPITKLANPQNGNAYQYAAANPCNKVDPTGRDGSACAVGLGIDLSFYADFEATALALEFGAGESLQAIALASAFGPAGLIVGGAVLIGFIAISATC